MCNQPDPPSPPEGGLLTRNKPNRPPPGDSGGFLDSPERRYYINVIASSGSIRAPLRAGYRAAITVVSITINPVNDPPVAANDAYSVTAGQPLNVAAPGVLSNDTDIDGDGYNPVDPIVHDVNNNGTFQPATDHIIVVTQAGMVPGTVLTNFAADEYIGDVNNNSAFDLADWILKDNPADGSDDDLDLWAMAWDVTGLSGCYIVRAVATDILGNTDDDVSPRDGIPDTDTNIWFEQCCVDSDAPQFCVTSYIPAAGGDPIVLPVGPPCLHIFPQEFLLKCQSFSGILSSR